MNASYPSGHTAASIAVYCGIALLLTSRDGEPGARIAIWTIAVAHSDLRGLLPDISRHASPARRARRSDHRHRRTERTRARRPRVRAGRPGDEGRRHRARREDVRRRPARAEARARAPGCRRPAVGRGAEEPVRARSRSSALLKDGRRAALRLGRRRDGAALRRRPGRDSDVALAVLPAGTANLFATNLGIPQDIEQAVAIGLRGDRRKLDVGSLQRRALRGHGGRRFRRRDDPGGGRHAQGPPRACRVRRTGSKNLRAKPFKAKIAVDGVPWYAGDASCILIGNVGRLFGGVDVFEDAQPRRRPARDRRRARRRRHRLGAHARAHGSRSRGAVAARAVDEREERSRSS